MEADPTKSLLEEKESAMLAFVVRAVKAPGSVDADEVDWLKEIEWTDRDLVDALSPWGQHDRSFYSDGSFSDG
ncbi:MAG: hypothetical protein SV375_04560 [Thermodesulfobacteriota bacterium]|nr:hypothetical protein [Thermodesulfobacteriota bacterium]